MFFKMALFHVNFFSEALSMCMSMDVILPEQTTAQIGMKGVASGKPYKTLYLLHGMSDDHTIWQRRTSIERYVSELGIAVVMPTVHLAWYTDMAQGNRYWTFISDELPKKCRSFFANMSDKREDNFAAGLSMGGYHSLHISKQYPDMFNYVGLFSAAIMPDAKVKSPIYEDFDKKLATQFAKKPALYWIGIGKTDFLYKANEDFRKMLDEKGYKYTYYETGEGHIWKNWRIYLTEFAPLLFK